MISFLTDAILEVFPPNWWEQYGFSDEPLNPDQTLLFVEAIKSARKKIFENLNICLLIGQYVHDKSFQDLKSSEIESLFKYITIPELINNFELEKLIEEEVFKNFVECTKTGVKYFFNYISWFDKHLKNSYGEMFFFQDSSFGLEKRFDEDGYKLIEFLKANIEIAKYDLTLCLNDSDYAKLLDYSFNLTYAKSVYVNQPFNILLHLKCNFLIYKWSLKKKRFGHFVTLNEWNDIEISRTDHRNELFDSWIKYIEVYNEENSQWKIELSAIHEELKYTVLENNTLLKLHSLIKYYKDMSKNSSQLKNIRGIIKDRYEKAKADGAFKYDIYVYGIALNFIYNNEFSLIVKDKNLRDNDDVRNFYNQILDIQDLTGLRSFFPQYKYIQFLISKLQTQSDERTAMHEISTQRELLNECKNVINQYERNVIWSKNNLNYGFFLPYSECLVDTKNPLVEKLFLASSIELPINRTYYIQEFEVFKNRISTIEKSIEVFENVAEEIQVLNELKNEITGIKDELINREIKTIENLAIFTTIIVFVLSSVSNFKVITSAYQAILFTLTLSLSLGFFVLLIVTIRKGQVRENARQWILIVLLLLSLSTVAIAFYSYRSDLKAVIDSRKTQNIKADSNKTTTKTDSLKSLHNSINYDHSKKH